jgi:tripartite-type tricarboxylate transporter receptor subunit TctC
MRVVTTLARERSEKFPDVPTVFEAVKLKPEDARLLDWRASIASLGRIMLITPGTPKDRVDLLRKVLGEILPSREFVSQVEKFKLSASYASAKKVRDTVEQAMTTLDAKGLVEMKTIALDRYYKN